MKKIAFLIAALSVLWCMNGEVGAAEYKLLSWNLVDSGKHMDWDGSTNYMTEWYNAINVWNAYKPGVIRVDRWDIIEDVYISDKTKGDGNTLAATYSSGKIVFYQDTMDKLTFIQRQATITHEIGHALGLAHNSKSTSIMRQGIKNFTSLDVIDKRGYDAAYKNY